MPAPHVNRNTGDIVQAEDVNLFGSYVETGSYRINTESLEIKDVPVIGSDLTITGSYLSLNRRGNNLPLLKFNTERAWDVIQVGSGAASALGIKDLNGNKELVIQNLFGSSLAKFFMTNSASTPVLTLLPESVYNQNGLHILQDANGYGGLITNNGTGSSLLIQGSTDRFFTITNVGSVTINDASPVHSINVIGNGSFSGSVISAFVVAPNLLPQGILPSGSIPSLTGLYIPQGVLPVGSIPSLTSLYIPQGQLVNGSMPNTINISGSLVSPYGSHSYLDVGSTVRTHVVKSVDSSGILLKSNSDSQIAMFGAGGGANATFYDGVQLSGKTANRALVLDSGNNIASGSATVTELNYVSGVTSNIQTQLDSKLPQGILPSGSIPSLSSLYIPQGTIPAGSVPTVIPQGVIPYGSLVNALPQGVLPVGSVPSLSSLYIPQGQLPNGSLPTIIDISGSVVANRFVPYPSIGWFGHGFGALGSRLRIEANSNILEIGNTTQIYFEKGNELFEFSSAANGSLVISNNGGGQANLVVQNNITANGSFLGYGGALTGLPSGVSDHGALTGLTDDDHSQYLLVNGTRTGSNLLVTGSVQGLTGSFTGSLYAGFGSIATDLHVNKHIFLDNTGNDRGIFFNVGGGTASLYYIDAAGRVRLDGGGVLMEFHNINDQMYFTGNGSPAIDLYSNTQDRALRIINTDSTYGAHLYVDNNGSFGGSVAAVQFTGSRIGVGMPDTHGPQTIGHFRHVGPISIPTGSNTVDNYNIHLQTAADVVGSQAGISFGVSTGSNTIGATIVHERTGATSIGDLVFNTKSGAAPKEAFRIKSSNDVESRGNGSFWGSLVAGSFIGYGGALTGITATAAPAGSNTAIQFNDGGTGSGDSNLSWNKTGSLLTITGSAIVQGVGDLITIKNSAGDTVNRLTGDGKFRFGTGTAYIGSAAGFANRMHLNGGGAPIEIGNFSEIYFWGQDVELELFKSGVGSIHIKNESPNGSANLVVQDDIRARNGSYSGSLVTGAIKQVPLLKSFSVQSPTSSEDLTIFYVNRSFTINSITALVRGSSPSIGFNFRAGTDRGTIGNSVFTLSQTLTSTNGSVYTSFTNSTFGAGSWFWFTTNALSGTVNEAHFSIDYKEV